MKANDNFENDDSSISMNPSGVLFYFLYFLMISFILIFVFAISNNEYEWMLDQEGVPDDFTLPEDDNYELIYVACGLGLILTTLNLLWINIRPKTRRHHTLLIINLIIVSLFIYRIWSCWQSRL